MSGKVEGEFNYDIRVVDNFAAPLERFAKALRDADKEFDNLRDNAAGGLGGGASASLNETVQQMQAATKAVKNLGAAQQEAAAIAKETADEQAASAKSQQQQLLDLEKIQQNIRKSEKLAAAEKAKNLKDLDKELEGANKDLKATALRRQEAAQARAAEIKQRLSDAQQANEGTRQAAIAQTKAELAARAERASARARDIKKALSEETQYHEAIRQRGIAEARAAEAAVTAQNAEISAVRRARREREAAAFRASPTGQAQQVVTRANQRQQVVEVLRSQGLDENGLKLLSTGEKFALKFKDALTGAAASLGRLALAFVAFRAFQLVGEIFSKIADSVVNFNAKIETVTLGVATLITAVTDVRDAQGQTVEPAQQLVLAQQEAVRQTALLRKEALLTSATFEDLSVAFQTALAPGVNAGLKLDEVRQFSIAIAQAAASLGVASNQLSEEIRSILQGTISARTTRIATALGISNDDIKRAREAGTLATFLETKFRAFNQAAQESSKTFDVILSNLKDSFEQVLGEASVGLFEEIKGFLRDIQNSLVSIQDNKIVVNPQVAEVVRAIADGLKDALHELRQTDLSMADFVGAARDVGEFIREIGIVLRESIPVLVTIIGVVSKLAGIFADIKTVIREAFFGGIKDGTDDAVTLALLRVKDFVDSTKSFLIDLVANNVFDGTLGSTFAQFQNEANDQAEKSHQTYLATKRAIEGVNAEGAKTPAIFAQTAKTAETILDAIDKLNKELEAPAVPTASRVGPGTAGGTDLFRIRQQSLKEFQDALAAATKAESDAQAQVGALSARATIEFGKQTDAMGLLKVASDRLAAATRDRAELEDALNKIIVARQVEDVRGRLAEADQSLNDLEVERLRILGREGEAFQLQKQDRALALARSLDELEVLRGQATTLEQIGIIDRREAQIRLTALEQEQIEQAKVDAARQDASRKKVQQGKEEAAQRARTPERFGGTQNLFQEFSQGIDLDVLGTTLQTAQSMVQTFSSFVSQSIFDAFNPGADLLANFQQFLASLAKMVIDTLIQIAVVKAILKIGDLIGGTAGAGDVVTGANQIFSTAGSSFGFGAEGGMVSDRPGRMVASPHHWKARGLALGGRPTGLPASDTVPAWLTPGEWVMRLSAVRKYGAETMARINAGLVDPMGLRSLAAEAPRASISVPEGAARAMGGPAPISAGPSMSGPQPTYLVANEQHLSKMLAGGHGAMVRWLRDNRAVVKSAIG